MEAEDVGGGQELIQRHIADVQLPGLLLRNGVHIVILNLCAKPLDNAGHPAPDVAQAKQPHRLPLQEEGPVGELVFGPDVLLQLGVGRKEVAADRQHMQHRQLRYRLGVDPGADGHRDVPPADAGDIQRVIPCAPFLNEAQPAGLRQIAAVQTDGADDDAVGLLQLAVVLGAGDVEHFIALREHFVQQLPGGGVVWPCQGDLFHSLPSCNEPSVTGGPIMVPAGELRR